MKILCVIDSLGSGGAQRQLVNLAIEFNRQGKEVSFLVYHKQDFFKDTLLYYGIDIKYVLENNYFIRFLKMRRYIRKGNYDVVISYLQAANFICEVAGLPNRKWKLIVGERSANPNIFHSVKLKAYRFFHFLSDYVVFNSHANMKIVRTVNRWLPVSKCSVIGNSVNLENWKPLSDYYPRKSGKFYLVVIASHRSLKNLSGLIEALSLLDESEKEKICVAWYGDRITGEHLDSSFVAAKEQIEKLGIGDILTFHPATTKIQGIIQRADAVGLFSFYEGFPNTVCEGMACAKPIICTGVSDLPMLLKDNEELLCDPNDPGSIANSLSHLISLSNGCLMTIGKENRQIAEENFNINMITSKYLELMN